MTFRAFDAYPRFPALHLSSDRPNLVAQEPLQNLPSTAPSVENQMSGRGGTQKSNIHRCVPPRLECGAGAGYGGNYSAGHQPATPLGKHHNHHR